MYLRTPGGDCDVQPVITAHFLIRRFPVSLVSLHEALVFSRYHKVDDHRRTAGDGGFRALVKIIHRLGLHKLHLEVRVRIYTAGHHVSSPRIDGPRAARYDEIASHLPANIFLNVLLLVLLCIRRDRFPAYETNRDSINLG